MEAELTVLISKFGAGGVSEEDGKKIKNVVFISSNFDVGCSSISWKGVPSEKEPTLHKERVGNRGLPSWRHKQTSVIPLVPCLNIFYPKFTGIIGSILDNSDNVLAAVFAPDSFCQIFRRWLVLFAR